MSKITDHTLIDLGARYSSKSQDPISNEIQVSHMTKWVAKSVKSARIRRVWEDMHSAYLSQRKQLEEIYEELRKYNASHKKGVTLLLFLNWTRYFRDAVGAMYWIKMFRNIGVEVNTKEKWIEFDDSNELLILMLELFQAQKYSEANQDNTLRGQGERLERGIYCHQLPRRFYVRDYYAPKRYTIEALEPAFSASQGAIRDYLYHGIPMEAAHRAHGGRKLLGPFNTWRDMLKSKRIKSEYRGQKVQMPQMVTDYEFDLLQGRLNSNAARVIHKANNYDVYPTHGVLLCQHCHELTTTSNPTNGSGVSRPYHVCYKSEDRHYRVPAATINEAVSDMLEELTLSADKVKLVTKEVQRQAKENRATAKKDFKRIEGELKMLEMAKKNALLDRMQRKISEEEKAAIDAMYYEKIAEKEDVAFTLREHEDILTDALKSINSIGVLIRDHVKGVQMNDFLRMLFVDGFIFDEKTRTFRTGKINNTFARIGLESMPYTTIITGDAAFSTTPPDLGGRPRLVRTLGDHKALFLGYQKKYA